MSPASSAQATGACCGCGASATPTSQRPGRRHRRARQPRLGGRQRARDRHVNQVVALAKYTLAGKRLWLRTWLEHPTPPSPAALAVDGHGNAVVVGGGNDNPVTREHAFVLRYTRPAACSGTASPTTR